MRRLWPLLLVLFVAATPEETKQFRVAQAAFEDKLYDFAESQLRQFLDKFPDSEFGDRAWLMLAQAQLRLNKPEAALDSLARGAKGRSGAQLPDAFLLWRGEALLAGEQYAAAETTLAELIQRSPTGLHRPRAQFGVALAQFKLGRLAEAAATLDEVLKVSQRAWLVNEAQLLRAQIAIAAGQLAEADALLTALAKAEPNSRWAYRALRWRAEIKAQQNATADALALWRTITRAYQSAPHQPVDADLAAEAWAGEGWVQFRAGQYAAAAEAFTEALKLARLPRLRREVLLKLSEALVRADQIAAGVKRLRQFIDENPNDPLAEDIQVALGDLFFARQSFAEALAEYQRALQRHPQGRLAARASFQAGWCEWKRGQPAAALPFFQQAFQIASAAGDHALAAEALFKVGDVQFETEQLTDAVASYQRLVSTYPQQPLVERALFQLGHAFQRLQNPDAALHVFHALVEQFPAGDFAPEAQFQIGLIHSLTGNEPAARDAWSAMVTKFPNHRLTRQAQLSIGESYYREGQYDAAVAEYDRLIAAAPGTEWSHRAFYNRGWCWFAQGKADRTLQEFKEFLAQNPQAALAPDMQFWIADHFARQNDYVKAQENFLAIHKNYPTSPLADDALFLAGRAAYSRQDYKNAIELFESLIKTYTNSSWRCDARFAQGDALTELGQFHDALLVFDAVIQEFPDCYLRCEALGRRADCLYTAERYEDAITAYRVAAECGAQADGAFRNQIAFKIGQCYEKAGKLDDAADVYLKLLYESREWPDPSTPPECFWLGKAGLAAAAVKEQKQQWRDAITVYQRMLELCPAMKTLLEDRIRRIRVEHFIWF